MCPDLCNELRTQYKRVYKLFNPGFNSKSASADDFVISIATDGTYSIKIHGKTWLNNAPTFFNANNVTYSAANKTLNLTQASASSGTDKLGPYQTTSFAYRLMDAKMTRITAVIKTYPALPIVIFQQVIDVTCVWYLNKIRLKLFLLFTMFKESEIL